MLFHKYGEIETDRPQLGIMSFLRWLALCPLSCYAQEKPRSSNNERRFRENIQTNHWAQLFSRLIATQMKIKIH